MSEFWDANLDSGYYDSIVKEGLKNRRGVQSFWHITTLRLVSEYLIPNTNHLDYACGPGTLVGLFSQTKSIGVDISEKQIKFANKNYSHKGEFKLVNNFDFSKNLNKFDVVTVLGLLEFLNEDEIIDLISKINQTLKPGGRIVLTTPNFSGFMKVLEVILNRFGKVDYSDQHINKLDSKSILNIFSENFDFNIKIRNFLNISIFFSIFSHKLADKIEKLISEIFSHKFGCLMIIELS